MKRWLICLLAVCIALLPACGKEAPEVKKSVFAMDTVMDLTAYGDQAEEALAAAEQEILKLDALWQRGDTQSEVYRINAAGSLSVSPETAEVVDRALKVGALTDGAFDITVAPLTDLWGFYTKHYRVPQESEFSQTLYKVGYQKVQCQGTTVTVTGGAQIDLGGIAKGYLSGKLMEIFKERGVKSALVSLGGNVQALGARPDGAPWKVAVQAPENDGYLGVLSVRDTAVITSGSYQRYFEKDGKTYHHILDPASGYPVDNGLTSVTVVCADGTLADGLSTAMFVMGLDKATAFWKENRDFEAVFAMADGRLLITEGLKGLFESERTYEVISA